MTKTETGRKRETETVSPGPCVRLRGCRGEGRDGRRRRNAKLEGRRACTMVTSRGRTKRKESAAFDEEKKERKREKERAREGKAE